MTDKATVEIPSPVDGEIIWLGAEIGDKVDPRPDRRCIATEERN